MKEINKLSNLDMRKRNFKLLIDTINELVETVNFNSEQIENIKTEIKIVTGEIKR